VPVASDNVAVKYGALLSCAALFASETLHKPLDSDLLTTNVGEEAEMAILLDDVKSVYTPSSLRANTSTSARAPETFRPSHGDMVTVESEASARDKGIDIV
jgi:hypothetical protein